MLNRKELQHSRDLIEKIEARLAYQRRLAASNTLGEKLQALSGELIYAMERRLSHRQLQHEHLLADHGADDQTLRYSSAASRQA